MCEPNTAPTTPTETLDPPLFPSSMNYSFTYGSNVSVMISNQGGLVESYSNISGDLPRGLEFVSANGELFIQGTPTKVTLTGSDPSNYAVGEVSVSTEAINQSGVSRVLLSIAVHPRYVGGDWSPDVVAETNDDPLTTASNEDPATAESNRLSGQMYLATNIPFASGGTGAWDDPVVIGLREDMLFITSNITTNTIGMSNDTSFITNIFNCVIDFRGIEVPSFGDNPPSSYGGEKEFAFHIRFLGRIREDSHVRLAEIKNIASNTIIIHPTKGIRQVFFPFNQNGAEFSVSLSYGTTANIQFALSEDTINPPLRILDGVFRFRVRL